MQKEDQTMKWKQQISTKSGKSPFLHSIRAIGIILITLVPTLVLGWDTEQIAVKESSINLNTTATYWAPTTTSNFNAGDLVAATSNTIYKSTNGGLDFTPLKSFNANSFLMNDLYIDSNGYLYASPLQGVEGGIGADAGLWRSTDGGSTWAKVIDLFGAGYTAGSINHIAEDSAGNLYATCYSANWANPLTHCPNVYKSSDGGNNWEVKYTNPSSRHMHYVVTDTSVQPNAIYVTLGEGIGSLGQTIGMSTPQQYAYGDPMIVKSTNGGNDWTTVLSWGDFMTRVEPTEHRSGTSINNNIVTAENHVITSGFAGPGYRLFAVEEAGHYHFIRTEDDNTFSTVLEGTMWLPDQSPITASTATTTMRDFARNPVTGHLIAGLNHADWIYGSIDEGRSWILLKQYGTGYVCNGTWQTSNFYNNKAILSYKTDYGCYTVNSPFAPGLVLEDLNTSGLSWLEVADKTSTQSSVGIGVTTPGYKLDVNGDINTTGNFLVGGVPLATVAKSGSASDITKGILPHAQLPPLVSSDIPDNAANTTGNASTATALASFPNQCAGGQFSTGIAANGNANCASPLIGYSSSVSYPLYLTNATNNFVRARIENTQAGTAAQAGLEINNDAGQALISLYSSLYDSTTLKNSLYVKNAVGGIKFLAKTDSSIGFGVGTSAADANKLVIDSVGNVGVGTNAPSQKLEVNGGVLINSTDQRPACIAAVRGTFWVVRGTPDTVQVCLQTSTEGVYSWHAILANPVP